MSEATPERRPAGGKRENVFTRKLGPLPMWAWVAIVAAALILWAYYKNKQQAQQQQTPTGASQIPQFVNQTFVTPIAPGAPDIDKPDKDRPPPPGHGPPWDDESKKDKRIRTWEHKHPGQEYPFNEWLGNPTAAQLAAYNANPLFQPSFQQSTQWPVDMPPGQRWATAPKQPAAQPVPGVEGAPEQMLGGTVSGKRLA